MEATKEIQKQPEKQENPEHTAPLKALEEVTQEEPKQQHEPENIAREDTKITLKYYLLTVLDTQKRIISRLDKLENKINKITYKIMPDLTLEIAN